MKRPDHITKNDWFLLEQKYFNNMEYVQEKLSQNYPIQYLIGYVEFCGHKINVDERVLIPRFETEELVSKTITKIKKLKLNSPKIIDVGTGSGCIAIALAKEFPQAQIKAIDISQEALDLAQENAKQNDVNIKFQKIDILKENLTEYFDIVISNPPYVEIDEPVDKEIIYEPSQAIFAEPPIIFYQNIFAKINSKTKLIALETGISQNQEIKLLSNDYFPGNNFELLNDLSKRPRFIFITKIE